MKTNSKKIWLIAGAIALAALVIFALYQIYTLQKAHSTFDNYYAFRGCTRVIEKTDTYGICQLPSGEPIKLVLFRNRWYLDGDLPTCLAGFCF